MAILTAVPTIPHASTASGLCSGRTGRARLAQRGENLAQGDAAIVWRNALVPINTKPFLSQTLHRALGQIAVLKAATGQYHAWLAGLPNDRNNSPGKRGVEPGGDAGGWNAVLKVCQDSFEQGVPIENQ